MRRLLLGISFFVLFANATQGFCDELPTPKKNHATQVKENNDQPLTTQNNDDLAYDSDNSSFDANLPQSPSGPLSSRLASLKRIPKDANQPYAY